MRVVRCGQVLLSTGVWVDFGFIWIRPMFEYAGCLRWLRLTMHRSWGGLQEIIRVLGQLALETALHTATTGLSFLAFHFGCRTWHASQRDAIRGW